MACLDENTLVELIQGVLDPAAKQAAENHLASCADCRELVSELARQATPLSPTLPASSRVAPLKAGDTLGRYVVLSPLGAGGMGLVYAAYDPELDRKVALKLLRADAASQQHRLLREARALAKLSHENVVTVHDVGTVGEQVFVAMELVDGGNLREWMRAAPRTRAEITSAFVRAGQGLAAAHAAGLVHRDFKPDNVLMGNDGRICVTDFGLARPATDEPTGKVSTQTETGAVMGTPAYMAPEQLLGQPSDAKSDQFSFCVALYEALYGERPFDAPSLEALAIEVSEGRIRPPPKDAHVPAWLRQVLLRGMSRSPDDRFASMTALLAALRNDPARRWRRAGMAASAVALVAFGVWGYYRAATQRGLLCKGAERKLAGTWDDEHKGKLSPRVASVLDAWTEKWVAMHTDACEATRVRGEQTEALLALRMQCLEDRRKDLHALVAILSAPDAPKPARALQAAYGLESVDGCADGKALSAPLLPPRGEATRIETVREQIAQARALRDAGRYPQGRDVAAQAAQAAKAIGWRPLQAETLVLLGELQGRAGDAKTAQQTLEDALWAAEAGHHDELVVRALGKLIFNLGYRLGRPGEIDRWTRHGFAALERLGHNDELEGKLRLSIGVVREIEGRYAEAESEDRRGLALIEGVLPKDHPDIATALGNLGMVLREQNKLAEAMDVYDRARAIRERALGPDHPDVEISLTSVGAVLFMQGQREEALAKFRAALAISEHALGPDHPDLIYPLDNIGEVLTSLGRQEEALAQFRRALVIGEKSLGRDHLRLSYPLTGMGIALVGLGRQAEAIAPLERALSLRVAGESDPLELAETRFALARALAPGRRARSLAEQARDAYAKGGAAKRSELAEVEAFLK